MQRSRPSISMLLVALLATGLGSGLLPVATPQAHAAVSWQEGQTYNAGTVVSYQGHDYRALVTHTAWAGTNWNPAATPALWQDLGASSGTPTPTPTPTPVGGIDVPAFCKGYPSPLAGKWQSAKVNYQNGKLVYAEDKEHNRIPDFSHAGYHSGQRALPDVPVIKRLSPVGGDNTARIQAELDAIGQRTPDANGLRGALLLAPGRYEIHGTLRIRSSGVVLRGSGDGGDSSRDTILIGKGNTPNQRTLIVIGSGDLTPWTTGSATNVIDSLVPVGAKSLNVADPGRFRAGQEIWIRHPSTQAWINAIGGGGARESDWAPGSADINYVRRVSRISGNTLHLDAPLFNHLDRSLAQSTVAPVSSRNLVSEAGLEHLRVDIETRGGEDEAHVWDSIGFLGAENSWARNVTTRFFGHAGFVTQASLRITVADSKALDPVAIRTGGRMYNFDTEAQSQLILFTGCQASNGRHNFISNGVQTTSGVVWHRCSGSGDSDSEGHRRWSQGLLFDTISETSNGSINLINRGDYGTAHGWGNVHSVIWNYNQTMRVQKPPTAQNYAISQAGRNNTGYPFPGLAGYSEIRSGELAPHSLYEAQLCERLAGMR